MSWILRAELIVLALVAIVVVIHAVNRRVLQLKYSLTWWALKRPRTLSFSWPSSRCWASASP